MGADGVPYRYTGPAAEQKSLVQKIIDGAGDFGGEVLHLAQGIPGEGIVVGGMGKLARGANAAESAANIERVLVQGNKELPAALKGGEATVHVYDGVKNAEPVYVGITNNLAARQASHGDRFVLNPLTSTAVTRGEARAIEQARIVENPGFQNIRNSISPKHSYYQQAVE